MSDLTPRKPAPIARETQSSDLYRFRSDSQDVARQLELAKGRGVLSGVFALYRLRYEAWLEERMREQILRKLKTREMVAQRQTETVQAENTLKESLHAGHTGDQVHLMEYNQVRQQRLLSDLESYAPGNLTAASGDAPISVHISNEQIEALALRAVMNLGTEGSADDQWENYRGELYKRLPTNVAQEVERRVKEMRGILKCGS